MVCKAWQVGMCLVLGGVLLGAGHSPQAAETETPKNSIAEVMKSGMKQQRWKKLVSKDATEAEKKELLELFEDLAKNKVPAGDAKDWEKKTTELVDAAKAAIKDGADAEERLQKAVNCAACHRDHKK